MALNDAQIDILVTMQSKATAELAKLNAVLGNTSKTAKSTGSAFSGLGSTLMGLGLSYLTIKNGIIDSIKAWDEQEEAVALLNATLESTGGVAGVTTKMATDLASSLQLVTKYADEDTIAMEGVLLTFTKITKDIFPETVGLVQDISTRMGQDLKSSAVQVGKALQDPILGMTALRRIGVNFNETDKETVKRLVESGKQMEAQKYILKELKNEFGGAAKAAGETFGGKLTILKNQFGEIQETMGHSLVESLYGVISGFDTSGQKIEEFQKKISSGISTWVPAFIYGIKAVAQTIKDLADIIGDAIVLVESFFTRNSAGVDAMKEDIGRAWNAIGEDWNKASEDSQKTTESINADTKSIGSGVASAMDGISSASSGMADKMEDAAKKIDDIKKKIKDLNKDFKSELADLKKSYKESLSSNQADEAKNVAEQIVSIEGDVADQKKTIATSNSQDEINTAKKKLAEDQAILAKHANDYVTYANEIKALENFNNMDSIDQAKYTAEQEARAIKEQYDEDVKNAKEAHKEKLKELKKSLKEAEKEYAKFFKNLSKYSKGKGNVSISTDVSVDAAFAEGTKYVPRDMIAMIHEGEAVVPKKYNPYAGANEPVNSSSSSIVHNWNFAGAVISDKQEFIKTIIDQINRKTELRKLGSTV